MSNPIISCHCNSGQVYAGTIVARAFERSFGKAQVASALQPPEAEPGNVAVYISPEKETIPGISSLLRQGGKVIIFGNPCKELLPLIGLQSIPIDQDLTGIDTVEQCFTEYAHLSPGYVSYSEHPLAQTSPLRKRHFRRYDYAEWNNLGYGAITLDNTPFAATLNYTTLDAVELATIHLEGDASSLGSYLSLKEEKQGALLWCARTVGPVDSVEWQVVERFVCDWREDLCCLPCLMQTPKGCNCLVTMRLDCDEDISSCAELFELYKKNNFPMSLAIKTDLDMSSADIFLMEEVRKTGGTLLSHSHTHPYSWGQNIDQAQGEAQLSREWFAKQWPNIAPPTLAVSPFHSNPPYAVQALEKKGFNGFVGGIIHNDPEYCLGRAGAAPFANNIVSISQQSMLHGDSYRNQNNSMDVHIKAFQTQYEGRGIFGYLDHPFSKRYQYGWDSEKQRIKAHSQLLSTITNQPNAWCWSQEQCFEFVRILAEASPMLKNGKVYGTKPSPGVEYRLRGEECVLMM